MKKVFKVIGIILLIVVVLVAGAALYISVDGIPKYKPGNLQVKVESTPERVARGKKLASVLCQNCHLNVETGQLTGKYMDDSPPEFGKVYSQNITQSKTYGIGDWTDGDIIYLLRTGIKKDGNYAPPWMAKLPLMSDEDINSIVAFLRSDDPMVKAAEVADQPCQPSFLAKFLTHVAFKPFPMPAQKIMNPDTADHVAFGKYLALGVVDCFSCHSADFKTDNFLEPDKSTGFFGGGNKMGGKDGKPIFTANITPDVKTGIGSWTQDQFITAVMYSKRPDGRGLRTPMVPFVGLDSAEVSAIYQYLKTVPPLNHEVQRNFN
jgi:mono/diheme cytochrome c family protein